MVREVLERQGKHFGGNLILDGDWFGRNRVSIVYKDYPSKRILYWRHEFGEYKQAVFDDIKFLVDNNYPLHGVTSDWRNSAIGAVKEISHRLGRHIPHQKCTVHTQRLAETLLTKRPKTEAGIQLLKIAKELDNIDTAYLENIWRLWLERWYKRNNILIRQRTYVSDEEKEETGRIWWFTHRNLRRAYKCLSKDLNNLFTFIRNPVTKHTNGLEALFSHMDGDVSSHRGIRRKRREYLISWYLHLKEFPKTSLPKTNT